MSTTGTFTFNPSIGSLALTAFSRLQIKRTELLAEHMQNAYMETNLLQIGWAADGMTFFTTSLVSQALTPGVQTYTVPANVVNVLDVYINNGSSDRLIFPFSRTDYASLANKTETGFPTSFWVNRVVPQTITLWPVPDNAATYTMNYYVQLQPQDAALRNGANAQVPWYWMDAYVADLSHRLSRHHAPALEAQREKDRDRAYMIAAKQVENADLFIMPGLMGYFTGGSTF